MDLSPSVGKESKEPFRGRGRWMHSVVDHQQTWNVNKSQVNQNWHCFRCFLKTSILMPSFCFCCPFFLSTHLCWSVTNQECWMCLCKKRQYKPTFVFRVVRKSLFGSLFDNPREIDVGVTLTSQIQSRSRSFHKTHKQTHSMIRVAHRVTQTRTHVGVEPYYRFPRPPGEGGGGVAEAACWTVFTLH